MDAVADLGLAERLRAIGDQRYHDKHPFHRKLVAGAVEPDQLRSWAATMRARVTLGFVSATVRMTLAVVVV